MPISAADLMLWLGLTFLFSGGGAYFGAYLKKKGENYAFFSLCDHFSVSSVPLH